MPDRKIPLGRLCNLNFEIGSSSGRAIIFLRRLPSIFFGGVMTEQGAFRLSSASVQPTHLELCHMMRVGEKSLHFHIGCTVHRRAGTDRTSSGPKRYSLSEITRLWDTVVQSPRMIGLARSRRAR